MRSKELGAQHSKIKWSQNSRRIAVLIASLCIGTYIAFSAFQYNSLVRERMAKTALNTLSEIASQQQFSLSNKISSDIASIKSIAYSLVVLGYERSDILDYLNVIESYYRYDNITIMGSDKIGMVSSGQEVNFADNEFFDEILLGKTLMSLPQKSHYNNDIVVLVGTPIFEFGKIVGLVAAEFPISYFNEMLHPSFENKGYAFIVDDDGTIIARTENDRYISTTNLFDTLRKADYAEGIKYQNIIDSIVIGETGNFTFSIGDETRIIEYRPLSFTGWSVVLAIPEEVLNEDSSAILNEMHAFNIKLVIGGILTLFFILFLRASSVQAIKKAAYYDSLTGIPNLVKFKMEAAALLKKYPNEKFTIVNLDIVNFKAINDLYDFTIGDKVLKSIAETGKTVKDKKFVQCRIGRDDFLLFHTYEFFAELETTRFNYEAKFRSMLPEIENHFVSYRYGRYAIEDNNEDINSIVNKVLLAHSYAKHNTKDAICDYSDDFKTRLIKSTEITNKQKFALINKEFKMYLQPKCNLLDGTAVGAEALVRWQEKDGTMIFPNDFIPLFENNGFIIELDMYMLEQVCKTLARWKNEGFKSIPISVNFSRKHLDLENFAGKIEDIANRYKVDKGLIEIELTEGIFLENESVLRSILTDLHDRGFTLSMDDFGTGYSSLGLLHSLPVDVIKLDRSFVTKTEEAVRAAIIVESVAHMTKKLGIPTVAEGVETLAQVEFLQTIGCTTAQGYYYSKPIPVDEFEQRWLLQKTD